MSRKNKWYIAGIALMLVIGVFILFVFSLLGHTDKQPLSLQDMRGTSFGWSYELLTDGHAQAYKPEYAEDGYTLVLPEGTEAVRITRTMTEDILGAELQWMSYSDGVEVYLDGELLHTDFPGATPEKDGFLRPTGEEWDRILQNQSAGRIQVRMGLPADYTGRELTMTTYFPEDSLTGMPEYPFFGSDESYMAQYVVSSFSEYAASVFYAILALLTAAVFLLDVYSNNEDGRTLLLCLYFALLFLNFIYDSPAGTYSNLGAWIDLSFLYGIYIAPLYLYLALRLTKWWRYPLSAGIVIWVVYECVRRYLNVHRGLIVTYGYTGREMFLLILALAAAFCAEIATQNDRRGWSRKYLPTLGLTAAVTIVFSLSRIHAAGSVRYFLLNEIWMPLCMGNFESLVNIVTDIASFMTLILVLAEGIRRTRNTRRTMDILRERERQSVENYHHLLAAQNATSAMRHEMRHHFNALAGILESGDTQRAVDYVTTVAGEFDQLPAGYYSQNILVNVIAGTYLDQARSMGIRAEYQLNIPREMNIADADLSVFLSNMLQNALEACEKTDPGTERFIRLQMNLQGDFLFIKCVNSRADAVPSDANQNRPGHGYGLAAMRKVAEKYGSILLTESTENEFEVKSRLCLKENTN